MSRHTITWQIGVNDAPLPPIALIEQADLDNKEDSRLRLYVDKYQSCGPIFRVMRSDGPVTVLAGPDANSFVMRYGTEVLSEKTFWQEFDREYAGKELSEREGDANRQRRARISRSYSRAGILDRLPSLVEMTMRFTDAWHPGDSIQFYPWLQALVAEQLGQLLTHYGPGEYVTDLDTFLSTAMAATMTGEQARTALQAPDYLRARQRAFELGCVVVAAHRASPPVDRQPDLVDYMLIAAARAGRVVSDEQLALGALGPFLAGLHTVTTASCYLLYALLSHPQVLERVRSEVDAVMTQGPLTWDVLKTMHTLHAAVMEALRLYPVSLGHTCRAIQPFTFADYRVEPGADVFVAMTVSHFLPELYPQPTSFDIDRYASPRNEHRQPGAYAPFGLGDHTCPGAGIAEIQLMSTLATLLYKYQLALDPPEYELRPLEVTRTPLKEQFRVRVLALR